MTTENEPEVLHPQEVDLVWRGYTGGPIPAREYAALRDEADRLGDAYLNALFQQTARQTRVRCGIQEAA